MLWTLFGIVVVLWLVGCSFQLIWEIPAIAMQGSAVRSHLAPPIRSYCRRSDPPAARCGPGGADLHSGDRTPAFSLKAENICTVRRGVAPMQT
jgi:hypothetical protein